MGRNLEAHRQRYIDSGDFPAFWLGFDAALENDVQDARLLALQRRTTAAALQIIAGVRREMTPPPSEPLPIMPEELLAALEPPKAVAVTPRPNPYRGNPALQDYLEGDVAFPRRLHVIVSILAGIISALGFILSHLLH